MKKTTKKLCTAALALVTCATASAALIACDGLFGGGDNGNKTCTVTFDAGWGTIDGERIYTTKIKSGSTVSKPTDPVCDGYTFLGWSVTGSDDGVMWKFDSDTVTKDTTLKAVWAQSFKITFDANGGKFEDGTAQYSVTVLDGEKLTPPKVTPPDDNHVLGKWETSIVWDFDNEITRDLAFKARWDLTPEHKAALSPFNYFERDGGVVITGVKDTDSLTEADLPPVVVSINSETFKDCVNLVSVNIPDGVTVIGKNTFIGCSKLKTVTLPADLTEIGDKAFMGCSSLESLDIPDTLTSLGEGAFWGCSSLESIHLPVGVTEIGASVFRGCSALQEVELDGAVTSIGNYAFNGCASLKDFDLPVGLNSLGYDVFVGCKALESVTIPSVFETLPRSSFSGCSGLKTVEVHSKTIGNYAFENCTSLISLTLGDEVETIGYHAFTGCTSLTKIEVPDTVTALDSEVFRNCTSLKKATLGEGITAVSRGLFNGCSALGEVTFDGEITEIEGMAFANCTSLLSFTIPASVTKLENDIFKNAPRLVEIYNLSGLTVTSAMGVDYNTVKHTDISEPSIIHRTADGFAFCTYKDSTYPYAEGPFLLDYTGSAENLVLPADYEGNSYKIFKYALAFNPQLKSVTISAGVEVIRDEILLGCDNVTSLTVDSGNTYYTSSGNCVIATADSKFVLGCKTSVIPTDGSVTTIGSNVFCHNATVINDAFKIPASVTAIDRIAFDGCAGIMRTAENHVVYVDKWAYAVDYDDRKNPLDLELEAGTVGICDFAFSTLSYSNSNIINGGAPGYSIGSFKCNAELKYIGDSAFYGCSNMTAVTLNNGLLRIDSSAFHQCSKLKEIVIPDTVQEIGTSALSYCEALEYVKLPEGIKEITHNMFNKCTSLKAIVIPSSVNKVTYWAFKDASASLVVYYGGSSSEEWNLITIDSDSNTAIKNARIYYYSETAQEGDYWHYGADGKPTTES